MIVQIFDRNSLPLWRGLGGGEDNNHPHGDGANLTETVPFENLRVL